MIWNLKREKKSSVKGRFEPGTIASIWALGTHFTVCTTGVDDSWQSFVMLNSRINTLVGGVSANSLIGMCFRATIMHSRHCNENNALVYLIHSNVSFLCVYHILTSTILAVLFVSPSKTALRILCILSPPPPVDEIYAPDGVTVLDLAGKLAAWTP